MDQCLECAAPKTLVEIYASLVFSSYLLYVKRKGPNKPLNTWKRQHIKYFHLKYLRFFVDIFSLSKSEFNYLAPNFRESSQFLRKISFFISGCSRPWSWQAKEGLNKPSNFSCITSDPWQFLFLLFFNNKTHLSQRLPHRKASFINANNFCNSLFRELFDSSIYL